MTLRCPVGFVGMTVVAIALRTGVGKTTLGPLALACLLKSTGQISLGLEDSLSDRER